MQISVPGYFLAEEIVNYFEVKKCSEMLSCAAFGSRNRFSIAKSGLNRKTKWQPLEGLPFYNKCRDDKIRTCDPTPPRRVRYRAALHPEILVLSPCNERGGKSN